MILLGQSSLYSTMFSIYNAFSSLFLFLKKILLYALHAQKPDGRIIGEELRRLLNCMVVKISDSEFKELMQTLDPGHTGWVNIYTLIEQLEESPKVSFMTTPCLIFC